MRKMVCVALLLVSVAVQVGCVIPMYSSDPVTRSRQLIYQSENLQINDIWERMWFLDMPDTATPFRTHGGVI
jgi:hypothetical protein